MARTSKVKIGDRFGKLVVLERAEDIPSKIKKRDKDGNVYYVQGATKNIAWKCKCDCGREAVVKQSYLTKEHNYIHSCGKCEKEENVNYKPSGMSREDKNDWDNLYEYVRSNIMGYDKSQSLPSYVVSRLKGLSTGNFMANNNIKKNANYSFSTVLNTFKFCSPNIYKALRNGGFKNEQHKINYVFKIVENNINDVYMREKSVAKAKKEAETMVLDTANHNGAEYQKKTKEVANERLNDLW